MVDWNSIAGLNGWGRSNDDILLLEEKEDKLSQDEEADAKIPIYSVQDVQIDIGPSRARSINSPVSVASSFSPYSPPFLHGGGGVASGIVITGGTAGSSTDHIESLQALRKVCSKDMTNRVKAERIRRSSVSSSSFRHFVDKCFSPSAISHTQESEREDYFSTIVAPELSRSVDYPVDSQASLGTSSSITTTTHCNNNEDMDVGILSLSMHDEDDVMEQLRLSRLISCSLDEYLEELRADSIRGAAPDPFMMRHIYGRSRRRSKGGSQRYKAMVNASFPYSYSLYLVRLYTGLYSHLQHSPIVQRQLTGVLRSCGYFDACGTLLRASHSYHVERALEQFHIMRKFRSELGCALIKHELEYPEGDQGVILACDGSSLQLVLRWLYLGISSSPLAVSSSLTYNDTSSPNTAIIFGSEMSSFSVVRKLIARWFERHDLHMTSDNNNELSEDAKFLQQLCELDISAMSGPGSWQYVVEHNQERIETLLEVHYVSKDITAGVLLAQFESFVKVYEDEFKPLLGLMTDEHLCPAYDGDRFLMHMTN